MNLLDRPPSKNYRNRSFIEKKESNNIFNLMVFVYIYSLGMFLADLIITRRLMFVLAEVAIMTLAMGLVFYIWYKGKMDLAISITGLYGVLFTLIIFFEQISMRFYMQLMVVLIITIIGYRKGYQYALTFLVIGPLVLMRAWLDMDMHYFVFVIASLLFTSYILYNFKQGFTSEIEAAIALKHVQETDVLTGLPNRRHFENNLRHRMGNNTTLIVLIDLDHFKSINDTHGHPVGDEVLIQFSELLAKYVSKDTTAYRWGGEEFLLVSHLERQALLEKLEGLRAETQEATFIQGIRLTISMGISDIPKTPNQIQDGFIRADRALYEAKNSGRNTLKYIFVD